MEQAQKLAFPFSCLTLLFLSFPICLIQLRRRNQSKFTALAVSITIALVFWALLSIFEAAGKRGVLPIQIAAWSPHALFLALASTLQFKVQS
jgi:lipopolysaccharide export LptBFGC system permease protein LptF